MLALSNYIASVWEYTIIISKLGKSWHREVNTIPPRTDNEPEVDQHRVLLFRFLDQGHCSWVHQLPRQYQVLNISNYLAVVEFLSALLIEAFKDTEQGSDISVPKCRQMLVITEMFMLR